MKENEWGLDSAQARVLFELEQRIKSSIQVVNIRKYNLVNGIVVKDRMVVGLRFVGLMIFPIEICHLETLKTLYLNLNKIPSLPEAIGNLQSLEVLNLSDNRLSSLPLTLGNLQSLNQLSLANNQFSIIPEPIRHLESLQVLNFDNKGGEE